MTSQDCPVSCSEAVSCTPDTTFTVQFYRQSRENSLFPAVSATTFTVQFCRQSSENPLFPVAPDTTFTVQFYRQDRGKSLFPAVSAIPLLFNFTDKAGRIYCFLQRQPHLLPFNFTGKAGNFYCFLQCQPHLLQQTFTKDGVLNILLVVENEACYDGAKQCR